MIHERPHGDALLGLAGEEALRVERHEPSDVAALAVVTAALLELGRGAAARARVGT